MRLCVELCSTVSVAHGILVTDVVVRVECSRYFFYVVFYIKLNIHHIN